MWQLSQAWTAPSGEEIEYCDLRTISRKPQTSKLILEVVHFASNLKNGSFRDSFLILRHQVCRHGRAQDASPQPEKCNWHQSRKHKKYASAFESTSAFLGTPLDNRKQELCDPEQHEQRYTNQESPIDPNENRIE
jgi:hypothetical protein